MNPLTFIASKPKVMSLAYIPFRSKMWSSCITMMRELLLICVSPI
jgi:hypothetical protein